jgi:hypothetical protein
MASYNCPKGPPKKNNNHPGRDIKDTPARIHPGTTTETGSGQIRHSGQEHRQRFQDRPANTAKQATAEEIITRATRGQLAEEMPLKRSEQRAGRSPGTIRTTAPRPEGQTPAADLVTAGNFPATTTFEACRPARIPRQPEQPNGSGRTKARTKERNRQRANQALRPGDRRRFLVRRSSRQAGDRRGNNHQGNPWPVGRGDAAQAIRTACR